MTTIGGCNVCSATKNRGLQGLCHITKKLNDFSRACVRAGAQNCARDPARAYARDPAPAREKRH